MKIVHVITDANIGGAGHQLVSLLAVGDCDAQVILPVGSALVPLLARLGVSYHEVPYIAAKSLSLRGVRVIYKILKQLRPHIVHTHASFSARVAARLLGIKVVHTMHCAFTVAVWRRSFPAKQILGGINNFFSDRVIATSPVARDTLLQQGVNDRKIRIVMNGVPPCAPEGEFPAPKDKFKDKFIVAYLARLVQLKGHDTVLDAAKLLDDNVHVILAGDGEYAGHLRTRIANEGITNVSLVGFISDIGALLAATHVQVNASYLSETTSLSLLQGMSMGVPAVVSDFGGNPYVITDGENGLLFPPRHAAKLAQAITKLQNDKTMHNRLSQGARKIYNDNFTATIMASGTNKVYRELV
jgi:glycosyltransferase involved in cell wall biosynthesis